MSDIKRVKPLALALGTALVGTAAMIGTAQAAVDDNPFVATALSAGYNLGDDAEGSCGEGKCGEDGAEKGGEGSCGEGSCGEDKGGEGACGEGKCGA
ncbi:MAG: hypothetical protein AAFX44_08500 [Pseudomonadota bacterium]